MIQESQDFTTIELIIKLIEILIWPLVTLVVILLFRSKVLEMVDRMGSFKAGSSGLEMTFQPKLDAAKKLFDELRPGGTAKAMRSLGAQESIPGTPYDQLKHIEDKLITTLKELAQESNIPIENKSSVTLAKELGKSGTINPTSGMLIQTLLKLISEAGPSVNQFQADEIIGMYQSL
ncbi:MAG: hypothetical protein HKO54_03650 [Flavobacteriaceae bacterium]|nr:hypothetical protein [Flavobacteriaceae bacterium]